MSEGMMRLRRGAIGDAAIKLLAELGLDSVMWGDAYSLDEIASIAGVSNFKYRHPLDRWQVVLSALDRDKRFDKAYVRVDFANRNGTNVNRLVRCFRVKHN